MFAPILARGPNPFAAAARATDVKGPLPRAIRAAFQSYVLAQDFSCLGAKAALRGGRSGMGVYDDMASRRASAALARDLFAFVRDQDPWAGPVRTFVASFLGPQIMTEVHFEQLLWAQLQRLHDVDAPHHGWDPSVSSHPEDGNFSFSFA